MQSKYGAAAWLGLHTTDSSSTNLNDQQQQTYANIGSNSASPANSFENVDRLNFVEQRVNFDSGGLQASFYGHNHRYRSLHNRSWPPRFSNGGVPSPFSDTQMSNALNNIEPMRRCPVVEQNVTDSRSSMEMAQISAAENAHANYLAQVAHANQLEMMLAAEAKRQHDVAVAAMHAHQCMQFNNAIREVTQNQQQQQQQELGSLEDIYCSSASEASAPSSNAMLSRLHGIGSVLSLSTDSETYGTAPGGRVAVKKYEVIRALGVGTYGKVKLTKDVNTKQLFAVKTINLRKLSDSDDLASIKREIEIMSSLHHPNIIHIREVLENKEAIIIVMECAVGGELFQHLHKVKLLSENEARRIFRQTVSAIYYCHNKLIAHRDLKLENILLDEHINVKIADFGLSSAFTYDGYLTTFCGSPLYAAPEIVTGTPYHGPEIDCWSLGVILYILVYGKMPFEASEGANYLAELCRKIIKAEYAEPPQPSPARDLIGMMLRPNPAERSSIQDIAHHWWMNVHYNLPVTHLPENTTSNASVSTTSYKPLPIPASISTSIQRDAADRRGSYKRKASQKSSSISSYTQVFPNLINIYKADTIDFSEEVSFMGNARPRMENPFRVMEPDLSIVNKQCILKRTKHKYEGNDSGCVLEDDDEIITSPSILDVAPVDVCVISGDEGISEPRVPRRRGSRNVLLSATSTTGDPNSGSGNGSGNSGSSTRTSLGANRRERKGSLNCAMMDASNIAAYQTPCQSRRTWSQRSKLGGGVGSSISNYNSNAFNSKSSELNGTGAGGFDVTQAHTMQSNIKRRSSLYNLDHYNNHQHHIASSDSNNITLYNNQSKQTQVSSTKRRPSFSSKRERDRNPSTSGLNLDYGHYSDEESAIDCFSSSDNVLLPSETTTNKHWRDVKSSVNDQEHYRRDYSLYGRHSVKRNIPKRDHNERVRHGSYRDSPSSNSNSNSYRSNAFNSRSEVASARKSTLNRTFSNSDLDNLFLDSLHVDDRRTKKF